MIQLFSTQDKLAVSKPTNTFATKYQVSPWLISPLYFLGQHIVLPFYFGDIEVTGKENIPKQEPVIIAPTHRSRWDAIIMAYGAGRLVSGRDLRFMVSVDEMKGLQGSFIKRLGGFPVDTKRPGISSLRHSVELLCDNEMLVIFPEGTIYRDTQVKSLKEGIARIALQAQSSQPEQDVKILPVSIHYSHSFPRWGTKIKVDIAKPLNVVDYNSASTKQNSKQLTADLESTLKAIYNSSAVSRLI